MLPYIIGLHLVQVTLQQKDIIITVLLITDDHVKADVHDTNILNSV